MDSRVGGLARDLYVFVNGRVKLLGNGLNHVRVLGPKKLGTQLYDSVVKHLEKISGFPRD